MPLKADFKAPTTEASETSTTSATTKASTAAKTTSTGQGDPDVKDMLAEVDLLSLIQGDTGETGHRSGDRVDFHKCPVCGHRDDFSYYTSTNSWCCHSASNATGYKGGTYLEYVKATGKAMDDSEAMRMLREATGHPRHIKTASKAQKQGEGFAEDSATDVRKRIVSDLECGKGGPKRVFPNYFAILERDPALKGRVFYDIRQFAVVVQNLPWDEGSGLRRVKDTDYIGLTAFGETIYQLGGKAGWTDALQFVASQNPRNLVAEWLDSLQWDGLSRMDGMLTAFLGAEPNGYNTAVMRSFYAGALARAYEPGAKVDTVPVLIGPQGIGKSVFVSRLCPNPKWFSDNFNTFNGDDATEKLQGLWIAEVGELTALKGARNAQTVKAFLTSAVDHIRPKYARETEQRPRACVFVGTTNDASFLTDRTGNRRFLPVECGKLKPAKSLFADGIAEYFAQAWAEAKVKRECGEISLLLPEQYESVAVAMREVYTEDDPYIGRIQKHLDERRSAAESGGELDAREGRLEVRVCVNELLQALDVPDTQRNDRKLINSLHEIMTNRVTGWEPYPNSKAHKADCGQYGVQKCYVPLPPLE